MNREALKGHLDLVPLAVVGAGAAHGPSDVATIGLVALTLILVALLASAVPAWRASEIDPVQALREE